LAAAVVLFVASAARADSFPNIVVNGSFTQSTSGGYLAGSNIGGWTVTGGGVVVRNAGYWPGADGDGSSIDLNYAANGGITQTLATEAGANYTLSFAFSGDPIDPSNKVMLVTFGDQSWTLTYNQTITYPAGWQPGQALQWQNITLSNLIATSGSTVLSFQSLQPNTQWSQGPVVDNISVVDPPAGVPEPGSLVLLGSGLLVAARGVRRKFLR